MKRLTELAHQLALLYRHGPSLGIDFRTIADHLGARVTVTDAQAKLVYRNPPAQLEGHENHDLPAHVKLPLSNAQAQQIGELDIAPLSNADEAQDAAWQITRMNEAMDLVTDVLGLLMRCDNETDLLERACSTLVVRGHYLAAAIVPIEGEERMAAVPLSLAGDRAQLDLPGPFALDDPQWEQHPVARAAESGLCMVHHRGRPTEPGTAQALIALPLKNEDEVFAVLLLASQRMEPAGPVQAMLQRMADELSLGIELLRSRARLSTERKQREIHLRQQLMTSQRLSLAIESADVGIWELDLGRDIITMDERVTAQHGLPAHTRSLPGSTLRDWVHPQDRPALDKALAQVGEQGQASDVTFRTTPIDGRPRVIRLHMSSQHDEATGEITGVLGTSQDVTDHARHEQQLRDLDAKLRMATEATGVGLWELDLQAQNVLLDGRTRQIYGLDVDAGTLSLSGWLGWVHPGQRQELSTRLKDSQRRAQRGQFECAITPPDGRLRRVLISWVSRANGHAEVTELVGTQVDVTERRRDEDRTAQTHQRLALLAGASGVGHWQYSLQDGFEFDEATYRMLGVSTKPLPAAAWLMEMCLPSSQREALELALITADDHLEVSLRWQGLDGVSRQIVWMGTVDRDARRTVIRGNGLCIDVTIQQQLDQARRHATQQQQRSGEGALTARVSHELRSPLNAILGFVQLMRQHPQPLPSSSKEDYLGEVENAGRHLLDLLGDAMDLSRIESGDTQPELEDVSLIDLMGELLPLIEQQALPQNVLVELGNLGAWPMVRADRRMLKQALMYIATRAICRSPQHGQVELRFELQGAQVAILVSDQGRALSATEQARVFEPHDDPVATEGEQTAPTGMRLAIARHCVEAMGGQLKAANRPGSGVTFSLTLPGDTPDHNHHHHSIRTGALAPTREHMQPVRIDPAVTGKVLYLEDNPSNVLLVTECLSLRPGIELTVATCVQDALKMIQQQRFDLALLDLQLPDGDGYDVLRPLRELHGSRMPCIALTANAMLNERNRALEAGFDEFWTKPLDLPAFLAGIDQALSRQQSHFLPKAAQ